MDFARRFLLSACPLFLSYFPISMMFSCAYLLFVPLVVYLLYYYVKFFFCAYKVNDTMGSLWVGLSLLEKESFIQAIKHGGGSYCICCKYLHTIEEIDSNDLVYDGERWKKMILKQMRSFGYLIFVILMMCLFTLACAFCDMDPLWCISSIGMFFMMQSSLDLALRIPAPLPPPLFPYRIWVGKEDLIAVFNAENFIGNSEEIKYLHQIKSPYRTIRKGRFVYFLK